MEGDTQCGRKQKRGWLLVFSFLDLKHVQMLEESQVRGRREAESMTDGAGSHRGWEEMGSGASAGRGTLDPRGMCEKNGRMPICSYLSVLQGCSAVCSLLI